jgi:hypothetical protein
MLSVVNKLIMLDVVMLNVVVLIFYIQLYCFPTSPVTIEVALAQAIFLYKLSQHHDATMKYNIQHNTTTISTFSIIIFIINDNQQNDTKP